MLKDDIVAEWLLKHGMWEMLINKHADWAMVHNSEYILKLIVNKKGKVNE